MKTNAWIGISGLVGMVATGCVEPSGEDAQGDPGAWTLEAQRAQVDEWVTLVPSGLEYIQGRGITSLSSRDSATLLHGAYAQRVRVDVGELSAMWVDWSRFGACARTLTFAIDEVEVQGDGGVVRPANLDANAFEVVTLGVGSTSLLITGHMTTSTADEEAEVRGRGGRGRGGDDEATRERCAAAFAQDADLSLFYTLDLNVVEAERVAIEGRSQCAAPGERVRMVEGGEEVFSYTLEDAQGENISWASNWSRRIGMWADVTRGAELNAAVEESGDMSATLSVSRATGELAAGAGETAERFDVEVVPEAEVGAFELGFWYQVRGFARAESGGRFWTYAAPDSPALWITMDALGDRSGEPLCGDGLRLEYTSRTPVVCEVRTHEEGRLYEARQLESAVFFSRPGECTLEARAPGADGGRGLTRTYTFTMD